MHYKELFVHVYIIKGTSHTSLAAFIVTCLAASVEKEGTTIVHDMSVTWKSRCALFSVSRKLSRKNFKARISKVFTGMFFPVESVIVRFSRFVCKSHILQDNKHAYI